MSRNSIYLLAFALTASLVPAQAATISLNLVSPVALGSSFDVLVQVTDVFGGRAPDDAVLAYGFNVTVGNPAILLFTGEDAGALFTDISDNFGGVPQVAGFATNPFGVSAGDFTEPLTLAVLHFNALTLGSTTIGVTYDNQDLNQGLAYLNLPYYDPIVASANVTVTPEPGTFVLGGLMIAALGWFAKTRGQHAPRQI